MNLPKIIAVVLCLAAGFVTATAQTAPPALAPTKANAVDTAVRSVMDAEQLVGVAVGVVEGGEVVYTRGYGLADRDKGVRVTGGTLFRWASCAKPLTAVAAMQLAEQGQLSLEVDVRTLVPEFPDQGVVITPRHLLCHQSGIVHYANGKVVKAQRSYDTPHPFADVVLALDNFKDSPLVNRPGDKYSYTTHGYILLSAVVQRAGGRPFAEQVRDRIAKPLGMTTLRPDYQWEDIPGRAVGYRKRGDDDRITPSEDTDVSWKLGGGGFISNVDDFARFAAGLAARRLVSEKTEALMWTPQRIADGTPTRYALGFDVAMHGERLVVGHSGAQEKTRTMFVVYPKEKRGLVVMTNSEWAAPGRIAQAVQEALAWR